jgi:hypothetical protein
MRVSDDRPWQSPAGQTQPSPQTPPVAPPFAPPGAPPFAPPFGQQPGAWAPPPKPGLIPLRPLALGDILGASFKVLRRNPRPVVGVSLLIKAIVAIITISVMGLITVYGLAHAFDSSDPTLQSLNLGSLLQSLATSLVTFVLGLVADALLQGIITLEVARGTVGEKLPLAALWRRARGRIWALVGWSAAIGAVSLLAIILLAFVVGILVATAGVAGIVIGILIGFFGAFVFIAIGAWLGTKLSLVPSALVLERAKLGAAIRRSWSLTRRFFWRTLGIELLVAVIVGTASSIVLFPVGLIIGFFTLATQTSVDTATSTQTTFVTFVISTVVSAIIGAITAIVSTSATALIYIDLRIRKEGLDLDLMRFVEARESGAEVPDPYLPMSGGQETPAPQDLGSPWS